MLALACAEGCWWLGLFLLNRWPIGLLRVIGGGVLCLTAIGQAANAIGLAHLAVDPPSIALSLALFTGGLWIVYRDARSRQETPWVPFWLSFDAALLVGVIFGMQGVLFAGSQPNTPGAIALLYSLPATAITIQIFSARLRSLFDRLAFFYLPERAKQRLTKASADLREASETLPRTSMPSSDILTLPDAEFNQLVRKALSSVADLPRLATSPLLYLPIVDQRLNGTSQQADTLERAVALKQVLTESIQRLKPIDGTFGTSAEWRHYNALYFPYVIGFKPYSIRFVKESGLSAEQQKILEWFRTTVPERTLYNWQSAAARLVAANLKDYHLAK